MAGAEAEAGSTSAPIVSLRVQTASGFRMGGRNRRKLFWRRCNGTDDVPAVDPGEDSPQEEDNPEEEGIPEEEGSPEGEGSPREAAGSRSVAY